MMARQPQMLQMFAFETTQMSTLAPEDMSAVETEPMSAAETGQISAVETGQMTAAETCVLSQEKTSFLSQQKTSGCFGGILGDENDFDPFFTPKMRKMEHAGGEGGAPEMQPQAAGRSPLHTRRGPGLREFMNKLPQNIIL